MASVHQRVFGRYGLGSAATQLMRAVSWHDNAGVSSRVGKERVLSCRADSGRQPTGFVVELGSAKCGWLAESRAARIPTSRVRQKTSVVDELRCELAGGAKVELRVAGPHAAQRQVVVGARAGGVLEVHAAVGLVLAASR